MNDLKNYTATFSGSQGYELARLYLDLDTEYASLNLKTKMVQRYIKALGLDCNEEFCRHFTEAIEREYNLQKAWDSAVASLATISKATKMAV